MIILKIFDRGNLCSVEFCEIPYCRLEPKLKEKAHYYQKRVDFLQISSLEQFVKALLKVLKLKKSQFLLPPRLYLTKCKGIKYNARKWCPILCSNLFEVSLALR